MERFERLQKARAEAGFKNATEAARYHGWNENTYRSIENGTRGVTAENAPVYARAFKINTDWLLYDQGPMRGLEGDDQELAKLISQLEEEDRRETINFAKFRLSESKKKRSDSQPQK